MTLKALKEKQIEISVGIVVLMLLLNLAFVYYNQQIIEENKRLQKQAEQVKSDVQVITSGVLHGVDLGTRGYAIIYDSSWLLPYELAIDLAPRLFVSIENNLLEQNYPDIMAFYQLRDSVNAYVTLSQFQLKLLREGNQFTFMDLFKVNQGEIVFQQFARFAAQINAYEDSLYQRAEERYQLALRHISLGQIFLILCCTPLLWASVQYYRKSVNHASVLQTATARQLEQLSRQNQRLELLVEARTQEIRIKNELLTEKQASIEAQSEELQIRQEELLSQRDLLLQNTVTQSVIKETISSSNQKILVEQLLELGQLLHQLALPEAEYKALISRINSHAGALDAILKDVKIALHHKQTTKQS